MKSSESEWNNQVNHVSLNDLSLASHRNSPSSEDGAAFADEPSPFKEDSREAKKKARKKFKSKGELPLSQTSLLVRRIGMVSNIKSRSGGNDGMDWNVRKSHRQSVLATTALEQTNDLEDIHLSNLNNFGGKDSPGRGKPWKDSLHYIADERSSDGFKLVEPSSTYFSMPSNGKYSRRAAPAPEDFLAQSQVNSELPRDGESTILAGNTRDLAGDGLSVLTGEGLSENMHEIGADEEEVSHDLLVTYMLSMGADRDTAQRLAYTFFAEQNTVSARNHTHAVQQYGVKGHLQYPIRHIQPAIITSKAREIERLNSRDLKRENSLHDTGDSDCSYPASRIESLVTASAVEIIEATGRNSDMPIVYTESAPTGYKQILRKIHCRILLCFVVFFLIAGIICVVLFGAVLNQLETAIDTSIPTATPSLAPTFIAEDILARATKLSGSDVFRSVSSPQLRAVGWMSSIDEVDTSGIGQIFAQRYAMIVLYYSFEGKNWIDQEQWLNPTLHECDWSTNIVCEYGDFETRVVTGFNAAHNNLQGSIPIEIGLLSSSQSFRISKNNVGGTIPSTIANMSLLSVLDCSSNQIEGPIPTTIGGATNLILLDLSKNHLNSTIPLGVFTLPFLRTLVLESNKLSGRLENSLNDMQTLVTIDLRENDLFGSLPLNLFESIPTLETIMLDYNQFTGSLPYVTAGLLQRVYISLSHNQLSGDLLLDPNVDPGQIDQTNIRLRHLDVSHNKLGGSLSSVFEYMPTMQHLDLSGNTFIGSFPSSAGWLGIDFLAASSNKLSGTIPVGWPTLSKSFTFNLLRYPFVGCLLFPFIYFVHSSARHEQ